MVTVVLRKVPYPTICTASKTRKGKKTTTRKIRRQPRRWWLGTDCAASTATTQSISCAIRSNGESEWANRCTNGRQSIVKLKLIWPKFSQVHIIWCARGALLRDHSIMSLLNSISESRDVHFFWILMEFFVSDLFYTQCVVRINGWHQQ